MSISSKILDAIELLTQNSIKKAAYDKTIQAQIISCEDETIGKYKCRYQDAIIYAYSNSINTTYSEKAYVYILVPDNDMSKEKTILGTANKLGINYISQAEGEQAYDTVGTNCINTNASIYLNTAIDKYRYKIYPNENNFITIDSQINNYIKDSSSLLVGATFRTNIQPEKQYRGHYGIQFNLKFIDNETNEEIIRAYILDQDNMIGNPYRLTTGIRQYEIFDIDGQNFESIDSIEIFCQDFFDAEDPTKEQNFSSFNPINEEDADIFISSLEFLGMNRMTQDEIGGVSINFFTPRGTIFDTNNNLQEIPITAQVKVKGKVASSAQNIPFYWGSENASVFANNRYYNKYLGKGWKCLNDSNVIEEKQEEDQTSSSVVQWVAKGNTYVVKLSAATAKNNKFKVAILYDSNIVTKEINIQNLTGTASEIIIESDGGTQFYYDNGHPTLTCKVDGEEKLQYNYCWAYQSNSNGFQELTETINENLLYERYNDRLIKYKNGVYEIEKDDVIKLENKLQEFKYIQRVDKNKIYDVQINRIISRGTFKCSVYNGDLYLGTAAITLTNKLESQGEYSLVINNGDMSFQYNEEGYSPTRGSLEKPQQLQSLSFTVYDNLGNAIDSDILIKDKNCTVKWQFPIKNTLLKDVFSNKETDSEGHTIDPEKDQQGNYNYYYNKANIIYQISDNYDIKKQRNQIKLFIDYKGIKLNASTNFTFVKTGQPGTNGTQYVVKIVLNTGMENPPLYPMITKVGNSGYVLNYGYNKSKQLQTSLNSNDAYKFFNVELWKDGEIIWKDTTDDDSSYFVEWEVLQNQYSNKDKDESILILNNTLSGEFKINTISFDTFLEEKPFANIIKCSITIKDKETETEKVYYGTIPIITAYTVYDNYRFRLKDYTGFRYVLYDSSGKFPQYDNTNPFEFICTKKETINKIINVLQIQEEPVYEETTQWIDISQKDEISYHPSFVGSYQIKEEKNYIPISSNMFQEEKTIEADKKNIYKIKPKSIYDGLSVNNAITCLFKENEQQIGKINIPVHFLLNKYGLADINQWDGNNIQIDEDKGFILSPQVGAGKKQNDNSFSGVLMGGVKNPNSKNAQMGLFGYYHGERTIFLNSDNGSAAFGRSGAGQIIIDPTQNNNQEALIYGGNYNDDSTNGTGMLINLSKPFIKFGSGKFEVNDAGYLTAKGGGTIAGWEIGNTQLKSVSKSITLEAGSSDENIQAAIYSNNHSSFQSSSQGFYLSKQGLSIGTNFKVTQEGVLTSKKGVIANWIIESNTLTSQKNKDNNNKYIEMSSSGNIGCYEGSNQSRKMDWEISNNGTATFKNAIIEGKVTATSGSIGGWKINGNKLEAISGILKIDSGGSISGGEGSQGWKIESNGNATFTKGKFGPWWINTKDNCFLGNDPSKTLKGTDRSIRLYANGDIYGQDISDNNNKNSNYWQIDDSKAYFGNGLVVGGMSDNATNGWKILPSRDKKDPVIYSYNSEAKIKIGKNSNTLASIGYIYKDNIPTITIGSSTEYVTINNNGKLTAKSADIATFTNKVQFKKNLEIYFEKGKKEGYHSLADYIKKIIKEYVNKDFLDDFFTTSSVNNVVTTSGQISLSGNKTDGYSINTNSYNKTTIKILKFK